MTDAVTSAPLSPCTEFRWAADPNNSLSGNSLANARFRILIPSDTDVLWKVWLDGYKPWYYPGTSDRSMATSLRLMPGRVRALSIKLHPDAAVEKTGCGMPIGTVTAGRPSHRWSSGGPAEEMAANVMSQAPWQKLEFLPHARFHVGEIRSFCHTVSPDRSAVDRELFPALVPRCPRQWRAKCRDKILLSRLLRPGHKREP